MINVWVAWSSGKDSVFTLYQLLQDQDFQVVGLLTTITKDFERVSLHSTRKELLQLQAKYLNLPLEIVEIPAACSDAIYKNQMAQVISKAEDQGIEYIAFGDLFLADVRQYREQQLQNTKIRPLFPLWHKDTQLLAQNVINNFKAIVIAIDKDKMPEELLGHEYNQEFLDKLPADVDSCGENGEFHTFVYAAPCFSSPIDFICGETVAKDNMMYLDLIP